MNRLSLKEDWGPYTQVSKLEITGEESARLRVSTTGKVTDETVDGPPVQRDGGFTQYQIVDGVIEQGQWSWAKPKALPKYI